MAGQFTHKTERLSGDAERMNSGGQIGTGRPGQIASASEAAQRQSWKRQAWITVACVAVAIVGVLWINTANLWAPGRRAAVSTVLEVAPGSLHLGRVEATADFPWRIQIANVSSSPVRIVDFKTSCGCTRAEPKDFELAPGEWRDVDLTINLSAAPKPGGAGFESPLAIEISPILAGVSDEQPSWTLTGTVVAPCVLDATSLVYAGKEAIVEGAPVPVKTIAGKVAASDIEIVPRPEHAGVTCEVIRNGAEFQLQVKPAADRPQGWFSSVVHLDLFDRAGKPHGTLGVTLRGEVVPAFGFSPTALTFGTLPVGTVARDAIMVDCSGGELVSATVLAEGIEVVVERISDAAARVVVSFEASKVGPQETAVQLIYQSHGGEVASAMVPVVYSGMSMENASP